MTSIQVAGRNFRTFHYIATCLCYFHLVWSLDVHLVYHRKGQFTESVEHHEAEFLSKNFDPRVQKWECSREVGYPRNSKVFWSIWLQTGDAIVLLEPNIPNGLLSRSSGLSVLNREMEIDVEVQLWILSYDQRWPGEEVSKLNGIESWKRSRDKLEERSRTGWKRSSNQNSDQLASLCPKRSQMVQSYGTDKALVF